MSLATLNVWITSIGEPCHIDSRTWFVHVVDCEGRPVTWCNKTYRDMPAKCGHLEVEIPPGCYSVFATWDPSPDIKDFPENFGNQLTHIQIVRVNCGDHACVTLFSPSAHFCGTWFGAAIAVFLPALANTKINPQLATNALRAVRELVAALPADEFSNNLRAFLPRAAQDAR
ncbi:MAG TPA: hypothetical protein VKY89_01680 [Thermoanaerobaculia bacterium]|nr:hypothetical protein [Thermoanaerobaculia bacterium]